jgi:hypothetical protein
VRDARGSGSVAPAHRAISPVSWRREQRIEALINTTLTEFYLAKCSFGDAGVRAMGKGMAVNTTLTELDLGNYELGEGEWRAIGQAHARDQQDADEALSFCKAKGAAAIAEAIKDNKTLTTLDLEDNRMRSREQQRSQRPCKSTTSSPRYISMTMHDNAQGLLSTGCLMSTELSTPSFWP